jgi:hypothetical protein
MTGKGSVMVNGGGQGGLPPCLPPSCHPRAYGVREAVRGLVMMMGGGGQDAGPMRGPTGPHPHWAGAGGDMESQVRQGFLTAGMIGGGGAAAGGPPPPPRCRPPRHGPTPWSARQSLGWSVVGLVIADARATVGESQPLWLWRTFHPRGVHRGGLGWAWERALHAAMPCHANPLASAMPNRMATSMVLIWMPRRR